MRVVFVDNLLYEDAEGIRRYVLQPHLGLISLIAVIREGGHEGLVYDPKVEVSRGRLVLDASLYRTMAAQILALNPDVVGLTSLGCNFICTVKVASYLKAVVPDLPVLLGGPHATILDTVILEQFRCFDAVVRHEAEATITPLLHAVHRRKFEGLAGISYRGALMVRRGPAASEVEDLDSLPMPAYDQHPVEELGLESLRVEAGRGCPFSCTFCSTASFFGRKYRLKSAARLVQELDTLHARYGVTDFALTHDLFTVNRHKVREFCEAVEGRGYTWKCSARMDCVDDELLARMSASGCTSIYYGIEAGSKRMQDITSKRLDLELFEPRLRATQDRGMSATLSFITGYPEETHEDQSATLDMIGTCLDKQATPLNIQLHLLTPEPGTDLLSQYSDEIRYDGHVSDFNFPTLESDDGDFISSHRDVFVNHHYFPSQLPRRRHILVTSAYGLLYSLGFVVLRHVLHGFDNRLSRLIDALESWAEIRQRAPQCTPETIIDFLADTFGVEHYLSALVRYMFGAIELRRRASFESPRQVRKVSTRCSYRLSSRSLVLKGIPDCPAIVEHLVANRDLPPAIITGRRAYLLYLVPGRDEVSNFELTDASTALLGHLQNYGRRGSREEDDPLDSFEATTGFPVPPRKFLEALARRGLLERTSAGGV